MVNSEMGRWDRERERVAYLSRSLTTKSGDSSRVDEKAVAGPGATGWLEVGGSLEDELLVAVRIDLSLNGGWRLNGEASGGRGFLRTGEGPVGRWVLA
jgi:hypothetical protein